MMQVDQSLWVTRPALRAAMIAAYREKYPVPSDAELFPPVLVRWSHVHEYRSIHSRPRAVLTWNAGIAACPCPWGSRFGYTSSPRRLVETLQLGSVHSSGSGVEPKTSLVLADCNCAARSAPCTSATRRSAACGSPARGSWRTRCWRGDAGRSSGSSSAVK